MCKPGAAGGRFTAHIATCLAGPVAEAKYCGLSIEEVLDDGGDGDLLGANNYRL
jgi:hypothetical protein